MNVSLQNDDQPFVVFSGCLRQTVDRRTMCLKSPDMWRLRDCYVAFCLPGKLMHQTTDTNVRGLCFDGKRESVTAARVDILTFSNSLPLSLSLI